MARTASVELTNEVGLHARPSVKLTQLAKTFQGTVEIALSSEGPWTDAKSPVKIMRLKAPKGTILFVRTNGLDEEPALAAIVHLVTSRFGEE